MLGGGGEVENFVRGEKEAKRNYSLELYWFLY